MFKSNTSHPLTNCQSRALELLEGHGNVFLTGVAGSGKSFLLNLFSKGRDRKTHPVVASTGAAAVLIGGVTFHSFFGLGIMEGGHEKTLEKALKDRRLKKRLNRATSVIIDEISMISGKALEAAEAISRQIRDEDKPWGGLKIIAVGDFGQLPPVNTFGSEKDWAFKSKAWSDAEFRTAYLKTVVRSGDEEFLNVLNFIREGEVNETVVEYLNSKLSYSGEDFVGTRLFPHRQSVEEYNLKRLEGLSGTPMRFETEYYGESRYLEQIKKTAPVAECLYLKVGALVMIRRNDPGMKYVNGSLGTLVDIKPLELKVQLMNGNLITLEKESFTSLNADGEEVASAKNFPVNLAWASTIHKSQGMTLDAAEMDLSKVFEEGQAYVALSRIRSGRGLYLTGWNPKAIRASKQVKKFHAHLLDQHFE